MTLPAAIWPYLWLLCSVLVLTSLGARLAVSAQALLAILTAYVSTKSIGFVFPDGTIYLSLGALIWAITATTVLRLGHSTASGMILLSALCYYWASWYEIPREVGSPPFVVSDVFMVVAMLWIGWHGVVICVGRIASMANVGNRDNRVCDHMVGP